jgi:hypothetical protein
MSRCLADFLVFTALLPGCIHTGSSVDGSADEFRGDSRVPSADASFPPDVPAGHPDLGRGDLVDAPEQDGFRSELRDALPSDGRTDSGESPRFAKCPPLTASTTALPLEAKYVDAARGDDAGDGSSSRPYRTVRHAFSALRPGDTLILRGGTYYESGLPLRVKGTAEAPVTIRGYPGERARIDGSIPAFAQAPNAEWEPVDAGKHLYRSVRSDYGSDIHVGKIESGGRYYNLVPYLDQPGAGARGLADLSALEENVSRDPRYVGPGIFNMAGRLYVRLVSPSRTSLLGPFFAVPADPDPRRNRLFVSGTANIIDVSGTYIQIRDLDLAFGRVGIELQRSAHHVEIADLEINTSAVAVLLRDGVHHVLVDNVRIDGSFPPWIAWSDMKGTDGQSTPASHWTVRSSGISGAKLSDIEIRNSCFDRVFDGSVLDGHGISIHHNRYLVLDDMVQLGSSSYDVEISHNWIEGAGPSHNGNGKSVKPGTKYIHHNVIISGIDMLWGRHDPGAILRPDYSGWHPPLPFAKHSAGAIGSGDPWKIYQNTVLYDGAALRWGVGYEMFGSVNTTGTPHEVYNNVFVEVSGGTLVDRLSTKTGPQIYDGNVYHRTTVSRRPLFTAVEDSNGVRDYHSLADFRRSRAFEESKAYIPSGWDSRSLEADPQLDQDLRPAARGPAGSGAVPLPPEFPGRGDSFRGALPPR